MTATSTSTPTAPKFLRSLYDMLHYEDQTILAWSPDGSFFQVFDTRRLEQEVLAKYYKHSKFTSLQRQLNNFGFHKWTKTRSIVCTFSHDVLRRCHPSELAAMVQQHNVTRVSSPSSLSASSPMSIGKKRSIASIGDSTSTSNDKKQKQFVDLMSDFDLSMALDDVLPLLADCPPTELLQDVDVSIEVASASVSYSPIITKLSPVSPASSCSGVDDDEVLSLLLGNVECEQLVELDWESVSHFADKIDEVGLVSEKDLSLMLSDDEVCDSLSGSLDGSSLMVCDSFPSNANDVFAFSL